MKTIQEVGQEILKGNPGKLYVFVGNEYGVKVKYLDIICKHYNQEYVSMNTVEEVLSIMRHKPLIPLPDKLYVVRYDEEFVQSLSDATSKKLKSLSIRGTLVLIYENEKHTKKLCKYLPDYTVRIDKVDPQFVAKYVKQDFPELDDDLIRSIVQSSSSYSQAKNICESISYNPSCVSGLDGKQLSELFGISHVSADSNIRQGIAARNTKFLLQAIDSYSGDVDSILYIMLSTMLELEKLKVIPYSSSDLTEYSKLWSIRDIYCFFNHAYDSLYKVRTLPIDGKLILYYLSSLLMFKNIPEVSVL